MQLSEAKSLLVKPVHPNISMHILHTVLCAFPKVLTRRICLKIKSFCILMTLMSDSGLIEQGEIRCLSLLGCKGSIISGGVEVENGVFQTNHRVKEHKTNCKRSLVDLRTII